MYRTSWVLYRVQVRLLFSFRDTTWESNLTDILIYFAYMEWFISFRNTAREAVRRHVRRQTLDSRGRARSVQAPQASSFSLALNLVWTALGLLVLTSLMYALSFL